MTYSIVARDPSTGELGVAVQSCILATGNIVPWVRAGVGAVATQAVRDQAPAPRALELLRSGARASEALTGALTTDDGMPLRNVARRQLAVVDAVGNVAAHTGELCITHAGHVTGDGFSAQGNLLASADVWPAMARAFETASGPLAWRLLTALRAAEEGGGDVRGRMSAALVVVPAEGEPWERSVDLRVDHHPEPLVELGRLLGLSDASNAALRGYEFARNGDREQTAACFAHALELDPDNHDVMFWAGLDFAQAGDMATALERVTRAIELQPRWLDVLAHLQPDDAPAAPAVHAALVQRRQRR